MPLSQHTYHYRCQAEACLVGVMPICLIYTSKPYLPEDIYQLCMPSVVSYGVDWVGVGAQDAIIFRISSPMGHGAHCSHSQSSAINTPLCACSLHVLWAQCRRIQQYLAARSRACQNHVHLLNKCVDRASHHLTRSWRLGQSGQVRSGRREGACEGCLKRRLSTETRRAGTEMAWVMGFMHQVDAGFSPNNATSHGGLFAVFIFPARNASTYIPTYVH